MQLGLPVIYRAHDGHLNYERRPHPEKEKADRGVTILVHAGGSIHHPEMHEFAALVTRVHRDGSCDLVFFPPSKEPQRAERVPEGKSGHTWRHLHAHHLDESGEGEKASA